MSPRAITQLIGWALVCFGVVFAFGGFVGQGGAAGQEPGADTIRALIFQRGVGQVALGAAALGVLVLVLSRVIPKTDAD